MDIKKTDIKKTVIEVVKEFTETVPEETNANLIESGIVDSLMVMNILTSLEDEFDFEVEVQDISKNNFESIDRMTEMVSHYIEKK